MDYEISVVPLSKIDVTDIRYRISTASDTTDLALSISAIGLLNPPVLIAKETSYVVLCGFRRISACLSLGMKAISARIVSADLSMKQYTGIAIVDNASQRSLNIVEQSRAYHMILQCTDDTQAALQMAKSIGLQNHQKALDRIKPIVDMPDFLQQSVLEGTMAVSIALQIYPCDVKEVRFLTDLFRKTSPGVNVQRELVTTLSDISHRDDTPMADILKKEAMDAILDNETMSTPQKLQAIRTYLKKIRSPSLSRRQETFHNLLKSLKLSPHIHVLPPPFFEGQTYRVTLNVDSRTQLRALLPEINKLINASELLPE